MSSLDSKTEDEGKKRNVLVIGGGLYGLVTSKTLLHDSGSFFDSVVIFEKDKELGGVWATNRIYDGLTTNSPLLTYEIPGYPYPKEMRKTGEHVRAQDVNTYLQAYAEEYGLTKITKFGVTVEEVSFNSTSATWTVRGKDGDQAFSSDFSHIVICTGLYHARHIPLGKDQTSEFSGNIWHSSEISDAKIRGPLSKSESVVVVGAGKSAIDLATLVAQSRYSAHSNQPSPAVKLVYRRPHWLAPRKLLRGTIPFEKVLFSRFVNAWLPYVTPPDYFHYWIAETALGKWCTRLIFNVIADDFLRSNGQKDLPQTIPDHPFTQALSGALHVEPPGYLDCVRNGAIEVVEGSIDSLQGREAHLIDKNGKNQTLKADNVILATGYSLALPFFSRDLLRDMGLVEQSDSIEDLNDLEYIKLYRLIVPPGRYPNIAFNGFAYSLLNPTVAFITAHWISDYFTGHIQPPPQHIMNEDISKFHAWQAASFGAHGAKGVHIGPHATLYTDRLLSDMRLLSGHVKDGIPGPFRAAREWFRPMFSEIYERVDMDRKDRDRREGLKTTKERGPENGNLMAELA